MEVFHYTDPEYWSWIKERGLTPINLFNESDRAIWALLEPKPQNWCDNPLFPDVWEDLKRKVGMLLLKIRLEEGCSQVFVVDRGLYELSESSKEGEHKGRKIGEQAYFDSKIPLLDYLPRSREIDFLLPEVIITKEIPSRLIQPCRKQPVIEEVLQGPPYIQNTDLTQGFLTDLRLSLGLRQWYKAYTGKNPKLKSGFRRDFLFYAKHLLSKGF